MFGFGQKERLLGAVRCTMVALAGTEDVWKPERGASIILAMFSLNRSRRIDFDSDQESARLADGTQIKPVGLVVCLNEDFRGLEGQRIPMLRSTSHVSVEQESGDCFAYAFAVEERYPPIEISHKGNWQSLEVLPARQEMARRETRRGVSYGR